MHVSLGKHPLPPVWMQPLPEVVVDSFAVVEVTVLGSWVLDELTVVVVVDTSVVVGNSIVVEVTVVSSVLVELDIVVLVVSSLVVNSGFKTHI
jgi:hypothetical protein